MKLFKLDLKISTITVFQMLLFKSFFLKYLLVFTVTLHVDLNLYSIEKKSFYFEFFNFTDFFILLFI